MYLCIRISILPLYTIFDIWFRIALTVWYFELLWQCGILNCSDSVVFWIVLTVWYFELFWQCGILNCSDSVVFWIVLTVWYFELFWQCGILNCSDSVVFWIALTVWYFLFFILLLNNYQGGRLIASWSSPETPCKFNIVYKGFQILIL